MAKVEGFKNKITKAQEELFKSLENEKDKKKALSDKIVQELSKQEKANVRTLNSLNKEYLDLCNNNKNKVNEFINEIKELNLDLQSCIEDYNKRCQEHDELSYLKEENEKEFSIVRNKFKREIQDINIKIDRIDKELKETLEERTTIFNENYSTFKNKVIEFDKRKRFEVGKIQNNTIKEYDNLQKLLLQENKKSEIRVINKKIKEIRYNGLIEEKECIFRHLAEQKQYELDYAKNEYEYKCENSRLEKEYNNKIEDTKFDRSMIEYNFRKTNDKNDNDVVHAFNNNEKQSKMSQTQTVETFYNKIFQKQNDESSFELEKCNNEKELVKRIYQDIESNDSKYAMKLIESTNKELVLINKDVTLFQKNINMTISFYIQNIIATYTHYFKTLVKKEEVFINNLIINNVSGQYLQGNSYDEYVNQVKEIFEKFKANEDGYITTLSDYLNNSLNNLIVQVEAFVTSINQINDYINKLLGELHENINGVINSATHKGFEFVQNIESEYKENINLKMKENKDEFDKSISLLNEQKNEIQVEFDNREQKIKDVDNSQEQEYRKIYDTIEQQKNTLKEGIEAKYSLEVANYLVEYENKVKAINTKFDEENKNIEKQYKMKMGLL